MKVFYGGQWRSKPYDATPKAEKLEQRRLRMVAASSTLRRKQSALKAWENRRSTIDPSQNEAKLGR